MISVHVPGHRKVHIACCYLPHSSSGALLMCSRATAAQLARARDDWYITLQDAINACSISGDVYVAGDFNARTEQRSEIADLDWDDVHDAGIPIPDPILQYRNQVLALPERRNTDTTLNVWGEALLAFCAEQRLVILNGRLPGDEVGALTFRGIPRGTAVLDYFLASPSICMAPFNSMKVWDFAGLPVMPESNSPFDHAPVCLTVLMHKDDRRPVRPRVQLEGAQACKKYKWCKDRQDLYVRIISEDTSVQACLGGVIATADSERAALLLSRGIKIAADQAMPVRRNRRAGRNGLHGDPARHRRNAWFDDECKRLRVIKLAAVEQHGLNSPEARTAAQVYWQRLRLVKRLHLEAEMASRINDWHNNSGLFWSTYKNKNTAQNPFPLEEWTDYFEHLYTQARTHDFVGGSLASHIAHHRSLFPHSTDAQRLAAARMNDAITQEEVREAMHKMHDRKSAGVDGLPAEFYVHAFPTDDKSIHVLLPEITRTFNLVFGGAYPADWAECALVPVPKSKGNPADKDDYRGIAVGTALSKLYSTVLLIRMDTWAESEGRRARGQAGFRSGRCTVDNVFVLQHALEMSKQNGKAVFSAFIDFRKAYDCINRDLLWQSLESMGIHGELLHSMKHMYANVGMRVRAGDRLGRLFKADLGVKQGDPLSPLLFGLFIDRFEQFLAERCPGAGAGTLGGLLLQALLYADDLVLLAETAEQLQGMLNCLHEFSVANHMTVNIEKSKVLFFNNANRRVTAMMYAGAALPVVKEFVYLGTHFYAACNMRGHVRQNMRSNLVKAKAALNAMKQRCRELGVHNIMVQCGLFNSLVASILNFGSEMWGVYHMHDMASVPTAWGSGGEAEMFHRNFLRSTFQVRTRSTGAPLMVEARRTPIMHSWFKLVIGWWNRIVARPDTDIVKQALKQNIQGLAFGEQGFGDIVTEPRECWGSSFYSMVCTAHQNEETGEKVFNLDQLPVTDLAQRVQEQWQARLWGAWEDVPVGSVSLRALPDTDSEGFKLATYRSWFCSSSPEKGEGFAYYINTPAQIKALSTFRMSSHDLNIELLRHAPNRRPRAQRLCNCCTTGSREDEMHILECAAYEDIRAAFADVFNVEQTDNPDANMMQIMNPGHDAHAWYRLANFLISVLAKRKSLLDALV